MQMEKIAVKYVENKPLDSLNILPLETEHILSEIYLKHFSNKSSYSNLSKYENHINTLIDHSESEKSYLDYFFVVLIEKIHESITVRE